MVAGLFRPRVPGDLLSQHQLQSCVEAMFAALPSPWQEAAKQWQAQQGTGQRYLSPTQRCLDCTASEGAVRAAVGCLGWDGVALVSARR